MDSYGLWVMNLDFVLTGTGRKGRGWLLQRQIYRKTLAEASIYRKLSEGNSNNFSLSVSTGIAVYPEARAGLRPRIIEQAHELPLIGRARGGESNSVSRRQGR